MIYTHQGEQNGDGTVQIIRFSDDLGRRVGEAYIMFSAVKNLWSGSVVDGERRFSPVMEAPFLFITDEKEMGILFTITVCISCMNLPPPGKDVYIWCHKNGTIGHGDL